MTLYLDMDGVLAKHDDHVLEVAGVQHWRDLKEEHYKKIYAGIKIPIFNHNPFTQKPICGNIVNEVIL